MFVPINSSEIIQTPLSPLALEPLAKSSPTKNRKFGDPCAGICMQIRLVLAKNFGSGSLGEAGQIR